MLEVTVLGCGGSAGVPHIGGPDGRGDWGACDPAEPRNRRTRSSVVLRGPAGENLLVDASPDMRAQLLACAVPRIDALLFTHAHADHILGLDDVRILNRIVRRPLRTVVEHQTLADLTVRFDYVFKPSTGPYFFRPALEPIEISYGDRVTLCGLDIQTFAQDHGVMTTMGLRVGAFGYSTDVVALDDAAFATLAGIDTWMVDCFQRHRHSTHAHLDQVLAWHTRLKPRRTILTHMGNDIDWHWLQSHVPPGIEPGYDGMVIEIPT